MLDAIKPLLDSDLITEETRKEITEAWEIKLTEAREQARVDLREEFAQRYEHDKSVMVEALDKMVTDGLTTEIQGVAAEKQSLAEDRVRFQHKMKESGLKSATITRAPRVTCKACWQNKPIGPAPITKTVSAGRCCVRRATCKPFANGSAKAAAAAGTCSGQGIKQRAGTLTCSAKAPGRCMPKTWRCANK